MNFFQNILDEQELEAEAERKRLEAEFEKKQLAELRAAGPVNLLPSDFAQSVYLLDGRKFRLTNRDYLKKIYDNNDEEMLLMCGRQVEKSTTISTKFGNSALMLPFYRGLYFAPQNEQVKVFSEDRLGRLFTYSQNNYIKRHFMNSHDKQNVFNKSFSGVGSLLYLRHAFGNGDNIRGISANGVFGDEIQDVWVDALPVIGETQAHARDLGPGVKHTVYAGTPKTFSNTIQQLWDRSNQQEWVVKCLHCGCHQIMDEANITPTKYICKKCGKELTTVNIAKNAQWVKMREGATMAAYRISQMMSPSMTPADVYKKLIIYPKAQFNNEVMGRSYENAQKPLPRSLLMKLVDRSKSMMSCIDAPYHNYPFFMGVDWGHGTTSFTIITIGYVNDHGKFEVVYTRKFKIGTELQVSYQKQEIRRLMEAFNIAYFISDYGDGFGQGQEFMLEFGARFSMCYYAWNQKLLTFFDPIKMFWIVNRDQCLYWYVQDIRSLKMVWPGESMEAINHLIDDHEVIQIEYRTNDTKSPEGNVATRSSNDMMFTHPIGHPDDSFHSNFYAWLASRIYLGIPISPLPQGSVFDVGTAILDQ